MSYILIEFSLLVILSLLLYYIFPIKKRWTILLIVSILFYLSFDKVYILFFLFTTLSTFYCGILIEKYNNHKKIILNYICLFDYLFISS